VSVGELPSKEQQAIEKEAHSSLSESRHGSPPQAQSVFLRCPDARARLSHDASLKLKPLYKIVQNAFPYNKLPYAPLPSTLLSRFFLAFAWGFGTST
jgi:hypothetical protein